MQAVWTASILIAAPVSLHRQWLTIPTAHVEVLAGAAAIGSVFAELFMIKSLLVFDPKVPVENTSAPTSPRYKSSRVMHNLHIQHIDGIPVECRHDHFTVCLIIKRLPLTQEGSTVTCSCRSRWPRPLWWPWVCCGPPWEEACYLLLSSLPIRPPSATPPTCSVSEHLLTTFLWIAHSKVSF